MSAGKANRGSVLHPLLNTPLPDVLESEANPGLGRNDRRYLDEARRSSGNLSDDPTASGEPVKVRKSFKNLKGG